MLKSIITPNSVSSLIKQKLIINNKTAKNILLLDKIIMPSSKNKTSTTTEDETATADGKRLREENEEKKNTKQDKKMKKRKIEEESSSSSSSDDDDNSSNDSSSSDDDDDDDDTSSTSSTSSSVKKSKKDNKKSKKGKKEKKSKKEKSSSKKSKDKDASSKKSGKKDKKSKKEKKGKKDKKDKKDKKSKKSKSAFTFGALDAGAPTHADLQKKTENTAVNLLSASADAGLSATNQPAPPNSELERLRELFNAKREAMAKTVSIFNHAPTTAVEKAEDEAMGEDLKNDDNNENNENDDDDELDQVFGGFSSIVNKNNQDENEDDEVLGSLFSSSSVPTNKTTAGNRIGNTTGALFDLPPVQSNNNNNNNTLDNALMNLFHNNNQNNNSSDSNNNQQVKQKTKNVLFNNSNEDDVVADLFGGEDDYENDDDEDLEKDLMNDDDGQNENTNNMNSNEDDDGSSQADALLALLGQSNAARQQHNNNNNNKTQQDAAPPTSSSDTKNLVNNNNDEEEEDEKQLYNFHVDKAYLRAQQNNARSTNNNNSGIKTLPPFNPSEVKYEPIEKNFYVPPNDITKLSEKEVDELRKSLDGARVVSGENPPRPMRTFDTCGLNDATVNVLRDRNFLQPFAVQSMAVPVLMSGRNLVLTAKTGSGKTLAYLLPLLRHVKNQKINSNNNNLPLGLVFVPTNELADQVYKVLKEFSEANQLKVLRAYAATELRQNFQDISAGRCDVIIATPGRLYDICSKNKQRLFLSRVSFVVLDEADRLFDEGLGRAVRELLQRVRPDHQFALISSTLPKEVKNLFKPLLVNAIEISVGGRQNPSTNVTQTVEFFDLPQIPNNNNQNKNDDENADVPPPSSGGVAALSSLLLDEKKRKEQKKSNDKNSGNNEKNDNNNNNKIDNQQPILTLDRDPRYRRLLQILGEHYAKNEKAQVIVFVQSKGMCDNLYLRLVESGGYQGLVGTLSSGLDSEDRLLAMERFSSAQRPILIATAVAERGLDVSDLDLVINYDLPDHFEAYVNRIGRTGRAGKRGNAISFFVRGLDDEHARMIVHALEGSGQVVPDDLSMIASQYEMKVKEGLVKPRHRNFSTGYCRSKGFSFAHDELNHLKSASFAEAQQQQQIGNNSGGINSKNNKNNYEDSDDDDFGEGNKRRAYDPVIRVVNAAALAKNDTALNLGREDSDNDKKDGNGKTSEQKQAQKKIDAAAAASKMLSEMNARRKQEEAGTVTEMRVADFPLNDYGERIRRTLTSRKRLSEIGAASDTAILVKGIFMAQEQKRLAQATGAKELYLEIRGPTEQAVTKALRAIDDMIEEESRRAEKSAGFYK